MDILNEKIEGLVKKRRNLECHILYLKRYTIGVWLLLENRTHQHDTTMVCCTSKLICNKIISTWGGTDKDLADKVKGESKKNQFKILEAKDLIGQVREKLGKDADAGDYIKDFRKSKTHSSKESQIRRYKRWQSPLI